MVDIEMNGSDTITITTFWVDWLLFPIMLAGAWLTVRWAQADSRDASKLRVEGEVVIPSWTFSIPLLIAAVAWVIAGFGTLIKEDYWEMRVIFIAFVLWTLCCMIGVVLLLISLIRKRKDFDLAGILNLVGLLLMSFLMILPNLVDHSNPSKVILIGYVWFVLQTVSVGLLMWGMLWGFPFKFPCFPLGLGVFFLIGWGFGEIALSQPAFPWMIRIWKLNLGLDYLDIFQVSQEWQIAGLFKVLVGIGSIAILVIAGKLKKVKGRRNLKR